VLRYYLIATAIVVTFVAIVAGVQRQARELRVASVQSTGSPSPPRAQGRSTLPPRAVVGDAPWAMSALPGCFRQRREVHGPTTFVREAIPPGAVALASGRTLRAGPCVVRVREDTIDVRRGDDLLRVPPPATLYTLPDGGLALVHRDAQGTVLRVYDRPAGARLPAFPEPQASAAN
jgi:hypothetical protein